MSSDDAQRLLDEWRQVMERLEALRAEPVDEITKQFRAELEARESSLAEQVRAAGLLPEAVQPRVGSWSPLPLFEDERPDGGDDDETDEHEPAEAPVEPNAAGSYEKFASVVDAVFDRSNGRRTRKRLRRWLKQPARLKEVDAKGARLLACALEEMVALREAEAVRTEFRLAPPPLPPFMPPLLLSEPWVPSMVDGFTRVQRAVVSALRETPTEARRLKVVLDELGERFARAELTRAANELLVPRPIPLVESVQGRSGEERLLKLTRAARWMPFFPNLLVNGCCQPLRFPVYRLERVVDAARLMLRSNSMSGSAFGLVLGNSELGGWKGDASPSLFVFGTGTVSFDAEVKVNSAGTALTVTLLPSPLHAPREHLQSICETAEGVKSHHDDGERLVVTFEHQAFLTAFVRRLSQAGALRRVVEVAHLVEVDGRETPVWVGGLLNAWLESCRAALRERGAPQQHHAEERLHVLEGLLRAADHEAVVFRIVDSSLSNAEAEWALQNVGSEAFRGRAAFSSIDTGSLAPFTGAQARVLVKTKALAARKPKLLEEWHELRRELGGAPTLYSPDPLPTELEQMLSDVTRT
ncbi:MAG: hypothetical protein JNM69_37365 [Archangium sp.]|nr:hypothetical protein [Archangium sp.]